MNRGQVKKNHVYHQIGLYKFFGDRTDQIWKEKLIIINIYVYMHAQMLCSNKNLYREYATVYRCTDKHFFWSILKFSKFEDWVQHIYIILSYFIFVEPFWLKQIQKRSKRKKNTPNKNELKNGHQKINQNVSPVLSWVANAQ